MHLKTRLRRILRLTVALLMLKVAQEIFDIANNFYNIVVHN